MLYREIIAVCSEIHTKHINTLCGRNAELLDFKTGGTYSYHWTLNGQLFLDRRLQLVPRRKHTPSLLYKPAS